MFLRKIAVSSREDGDFVLFGIGGLTPLGGFVTHADGRGVCDETKTAAGLFWPMPIALSTDRRMADDIRTGSEVTLADSEAGKVLAIMKIGGKLGPTAPWRS